MVIPKKILKKLYINEKLSSWDIGEKLNISRSTIFKKLKEFRLIRDRATAHIVYPKKDFNGDLKEKFYLIGFRIGDLRVRKQYENSKTICIACSSTIPEQIELIEGLFKKYGRVWIKKSRDKKVIHSEAFVNESFNFLLEKKVPENLLKTKLNFFSFLAGFIDAEGHIGVYNKMARFSLGNYDSRALFFIYEKLNEFGINCNKPLSDNRKGKMNSQGYKYNQDYWHFNINRKDELLKLFVFIEPYLKHKNKIKDLNKAEKNILERNKKFGLKLKR